MRIWLVTIGETLPTIYEEERPMRTTLLARELAKRGHQVLWWTSSFHHFRKVQLSRNKDTWRDRSGFILQTISSPGYARNLSIRRILDHIFQAIAYFRNARHAEPPDIILCSYPTIELSWASILLGRKFQIPVVIDVRDLWPDTVREASSGLLQKISWLLLLPFENVAKRILRGATSITGVSNGSIEWAP